MGLSPHGRWNWNGQVRLVPGLIRGGSLGGMGLRRAESALCRLSLAACESLVLLLPCRLLLGFRVFERDLRGVSALAGVCALLEVKDDCPDCPLPADDAPPLRPKFGAGG